LKNIGTPQPQKEAVMETVKNNEFEADMRPNWVNQIQSQRNHTQLNSPHHKDEDSLAEHGFDSAIWH
jgi:hypothetical protein